MKTRKVFKSQDGRKAIFEMYDFGLSQWPVPYEEQMIQTRYGSTHAIICGEKLAPPLILLHGTGSNSIMWLGDISEYSRHYRVYALDIPGEPGKSGEEQFPLNSPVYSEWLDEILNALGLTSVTLLGLSLGAWISLNYSTKYTERVNKLVLLCPSGIEPPKLTFMLYAIPLMLFGQKGIDKVTRIINGNKDVPEEVLRYSRVLSTNFNLRTEAVPIFTDVELKKLSMPVLLLAGEKDALLHSGKTVARVKGLLPQAETYLLPGVGHVLVNLTDRILPFLLSEHSNT